MNALTVATRLALLALSGVALATGCQNDRSETCDRYLELAPIWECVDPEAWGSGGGCPTDEELAARDGGFATLDECVTFLEGQCDPEIAVGCSCLTDDHCQCAIPLGAQRFACVPEPAP